MLTVAIDETGIQVMVNDRIGPADGAATELRQAQGQNRRYPDFLCIGAQKAGTTWLDSSLRKHPGIWLPPVKELHYFSEVHIADNRSWASASRRKMGVRVLRDYLKRVDERNWDYRFVARAADIISGVPSDEWYGNIFSLAGPNQLCGEITPAYALLPPGGIEHMTRLMPELKILMLLRDPIERSWSHLRMLAEEGEKINIPALIRAAGSPRIVERSNYPKILDLWTGHFSKDRLLVGFMEDIVSAPDRLLRKICEFLGVDYEDKWSSSLQSAVHVGKDVAIPPEVYEFLKVQLHPVYTALQVRYPEVVGKWISRHYG